MIGKPKRAAEPLELWARLIVVSSLHLSCLPYVRRFGFCPKEFFLIPAILHKHLKLSLRDGIARDVIAVGNLNLDALSLFSHVKGPCGNFYKS
jgi:hypothetical protein